MSGNVYHVIGPPGTGKTTHLARRIAATRKLRGEDSVCVVAYTKVAAAEIGGRIGDGGNGKSKRSKRGEGGCEPGEAKEKRVGTLHSILFHLLGGKSSVKLAQPKEWNSCHSEMLHLSGEGVSMDDLDEPKGKTEGDKLKAVCDQLRAKMVPRELWPSHARMFDVPWRRWKEETGYTDFTDWVEMAIERRLPPPAGCTVGICDEAQDFSRLEITLLKWWGECFANDGGATVFAYDDDQAIFSFKGVEATALVDGLPADEKHSHVLAQSYRVPRAVHARAVRWIEQCKKRVPKTYLPRPEDGRVNHLQHATFREPYAMIDAVQSDLKNGLDCMILTTCTYMLQATIKQLRLNGIPFHNPYRPAQGAWNPLAAGKTAQRILQFIKRCPRYSSEGEAMLHMWTFAQLADWTRDLGASCFVGRGKKQELLDLAKDKERKNELVRAEDYLSDACLAWTDAADFVAYERAILGNNRRSYEFPLALARRDIRLLTEKPRVVIGTVHSVKGAEAASVYLAPDLSMAGYDQWSRRGTPQHDDVRRVFYVAMTRARETLTILGPGSNLAVEGI